MFFKIVAMREFIIGKKIIVNKISDNKKIKRYNKKNRLKEGCSKFEKIRCKKKKIIEK
ncbi:MAG: hypothetical protein QXE31_01895 [Candidatus Woesearchaeota archaeon]